MKTKQDLIDNGFQIVAKDTDNLETWAKFLESTNTVQHIFFKNDCCVGELQTTSLSVLYLNHIIFEGLMFGVGAGKRNIIPEHMWVEEWKTEMFKR